MVVEDDRNAPGGQSLDDLVINLQRGKSSELWIGRDPAVLDLVRVVDHLIREWQPDGIDSQLFERLDDLVDWCILQSERKIMRILGTVMRVVCVPIPVSVVSPTCSMPVSRLEFEAIAISVNDVAPPGAERAIPSHDRPQEQNEGGKDRL